MKIKTDKLNRKAVIRLATVAFICVVAIYSAVVLLSNYSDISRLKAKANEVNAQYAQQVDENDKVKAILNNKNKDEYIAELNKMSNDNYMAVALFVTDIIKNGSYILFNDAALDIIREAYGNDKINQGTYLDGFVSRKKQMLPSLLEEIEKRA